MTPVPSLDALQTALDYRFHNGRLLEEALTHKSYVNEQRAAASTHNERLEFLGDAVLSLAVSEQLASLLPHSPEGVLSKHKARLVSESMLAELAKRLGLGSCLRLGRGEELSGGREKDSLLADAIEAVIAAVHLDGGLEASRRLVSRLLREEFSQVVNQRHRAGEDDYKTQVQEWCQRRFDSLPSYAVVRESGPDHDKLFEVEVTVNGEVVGRGTGRSKKEAEQSAAKQALQEGRP
ncbi:MAG TPA: ribonuclease III [Nitrospira sp.]|jgi:ribonuclease-3|nr:ribonuclease III [Nitrospira sp.]